MKRGSNQGNNEIGVKRNHRENQSMHNR